ncbi:MAG TPA: class II aldolase/adducin family protein [Gemmatimonadales bacterium]
MSRSALLQAAVASARLGLNHGATGNLSMRHDAGMLITPTAVPYERLAEDDLVLMALDGAVASGARRPSSEWRLHAGVYQRRADVNAIVHAHPRFATTLACLREDLPAVHYMIALAGGDRIRCSGYAPFGSAELSAAAVEALGDRQACLLANHGLVTVGGDLELALRIALEVETVAEYWWRARAIGQPVLLTPAEIADARARFEDYS